jgi:hypothetical protein
MRPVASDGAVDFIVNGADVIECFDLMGRSRSSSGLRAIAAELHWHATPLCGRAAGQRSAGFYFR